MEKERGGLPSEQLRDLARDLDPQDHGAKFTAGEQSQNRGLAAGPDFYFLGGRPLLSFGSVMPRRFAQPTTPLRMASTEMTGRP
jgi:hypothetical protein